MGNTNTTELTLEEKKARNREAVRRYYAANKEKVKERKRKYTESNKEKEAERKRKYNAANKEKIYERQKKYRRANLKKYAEQMRKWRKNNREKHLQYVCEYQKKRRANKVFHLLQCLRERQNKAVSKKYRSGSAVRDMGCTGQEACNHLESLFNENMTWENWGTYWHLDHIFPLAAANLEDRAEFLAVVNWRNLQPLEAKANMSKGDKVTPAARRLFNKLVKEFS